MKRMLLIFAGLILSYATIAQRTIPLRNIWVKPRVHIMFQGYTLSFTIKDIDKAMSLLNETGNYTYGISSGLDTAKEYFVELYPGIRQEYHNELQPLMQNGVGPFLLSAGHAYVENAKHKRLKEVVMDIQPIIQGTNEVTILFYDPRTNKLLFSGRMMADMYKRDLGIE